jgi:hypothetical protein
MTDKKGEPKRKPYAKPSLKVYGNVRDLTRAATSGRNRDIQQFGQNSRT